jgi:hypothetical protein
MTYEDQVATLFAKANPVPSLNLLDPVELLDMDSLDGLSGRSGVMIKVEDTQPKKEQRRLRPSLAIGLVTVAIVFVVLGILLNSQEEVAVASPQEVAAAYLEAAAAHDLDAATELLAPDVVVEEMEEWEHDRAYGWVVHNQGCEETSTGPDGTTVRCSVEVVADVAQALGLEPGTGTYRIIVDDGQVRSVRLNFEDFGGLEEAWDVFRVWVEENHPDDVATMYDPATEFSAQSIALWEQYVDEYLASLEG